MTRGTRAITGALRTLCLVCLACLACALPAVAQAQVGYTGTEPPDCLEYPRGKGCRAVRVDAILIEGLGRTMRHVVTRELLFEEGDYASERQIAESMARLRNMGLFREVRYQLLSNAVEGASEGPRRFPARIMRIVLDERWTLLPAFSFLQGGGLTQLVVAAYDINVGGRFLEMGAQYERLGFSESFWQSGGATSSFFLWFRDPRFLNTRLWTGLDIARQLRMRTLYDEDGGVEGGFLRDSVLVRARAEREFSWWLRMGASVDFSQDDFSTDLIPQDTSEAQQRTFGGLPRDGRTILVSATARIGRVNQEDFRYEGVRLFHTISHADSLWGSEFRFTRMVSDLSFFKKTPWQGNLAMRARLGLGNARQLQHLFYMGGLDRVRGFQDSRFRGKNYWNANAEYRQAVFTSQWMVVQPVVFADAGATADRAADLGGVTAASVGGGVRLILPNIYGFVARLDYAVPLLKTGGNALSFGAQQFF